MKFIKIVLVGLLIAFIFLIFGLNLIPGSDFAGFILLPVIIIIALYIVLSSVFVGFLQQKNILKPGGMRKRTLLILIIVVVSYLLYGFFQSTYPYSLFGWK